MHNCQCACHKKKGFLEKLVYTFYSIVVGSIYLLLFSFLSAGAVSSVILLIKTLPEYQNYITTFIDLSAIAGQIAMVSMGLLFLSIVLLAIKNLFSKPKRTVEVFR